MKSKDSIFFKIIYLWLCWVFVVAWAFSSCGKWGLLSVAVSGLLTAVASRCGAPALGLQAVVVVVRGFTCPAACGIFPDQGSNPCPLHW